MKELVETGVKHINELFLSYSVFLKQRYPINTNFLPLHFKSAVHITIHIMTFLT